MTTSLNTDLRYCINHDNAVCSIFIETPSSLIESPLYQANLNSEKQIFL